MIVGGRAMRGRWRAAEANLAFGALIHEADRLHALGQPVDTPHVLAPSAALVVLVRNITDSPTFAPYRVQPDLPWPLVFAAGPRDASVVLLVDRMLLNVRGYHRYGTFQPSGEDFQVVLHCTLVAWAERRVLLDYSVRGDAPSNRAGLPTVFGLTNRVGPDPWPEAGRRLSSYMKRF